MNCVLRQTTQFKKGLKRVRKQGKDLLKLSAVVELLAKGSPLPPANHDHALSGDYAGCRECHIEPDWLLVYRYQQEELVLLLVDTGSHSDLFG